MTHNEREFRDMKKYLRDLIEVVEASIELLDDEMKKPSTAIRGGRIAKICNALELSKDLAKRYGLPTQQRKKKEESK